MFTLEHINDVHDRLGNAETFTEYVRALKSLGVEGFSSYLSDGHSEYFGRDGYTLESPAVHEQLTIADTGNREQFLEHLHLHAQHKTTYLEMSKGLADSGIERWTVDANKLTMAYYDKAGNELLLEMLS